MCTLNYISTKKSITSIKKTKAMYHGIKKRKAQKTPWWHYEPVVNGNKETKKELPENRPRKVKTVYYAQKK